MKVFLAIVVAVALGVAFGMGLAEWRMRQTPWKGVPIDEGRSATAAPPRNVSKLPKVAVDEEEYNFSVMDSNGEMSHEFRLTNVGGSPLILTKGPTTCRCTVSEVKDNQLKPGESTSVTLTWKGRGLRGEYRQSATIYTNDPSRQEVKLAVVGRVAAAVWAEPHELVFTHLSQREPDSGEVRLYCGLSERLKIVEWHFTDAALAKQFTVAIEPLPEKGPPLPVDARSGVLLKIGVKAGLPPGPLQQTISLTTNLKSVPPLSLDIKGTVGSEISVAGEGWIQDLGMVSLGIVDSQIGAERRLMLIAHGPHCKGVKFKAIKVDPDFLRVTLGKTTSIGATATQTPLIVQIPKGCRPVNRIGSEQGKLGKIVFETGDPDMPEMTVYLRFLIEGE